jgi:hypothetical protein
VCRRDDCGLAAGGNNNLKNSPYGIVSCSRWVNDEITPDTEMEEEKAEGESMRYFLYEQADKFFVDHIPIESIKDLDTGCKFAYLFRFSSKLLT